MGPTEIAVLRVLSLPAPTMTPGLSFKIAHMAMVKANIFFLVYSVSILIQMENRRASSPIRFQILREA